ncbi:MAG: hybrid sensor histidine kinase/response regulator, partial [Acidobacteria bacterium]
PGQGSTFTLYLPQHHVPLRPKSPKETVVPSEVSAPREEGVFSMAEEALFAPLPSDIQDDRSNLKPGDQIFLIVEDDITFASLLLDLAREHGFKGLIAFT